jgi:hypothetical protein
VSFAAHGAQSGVHLVSGDPAATSFLPLDTSSALQARTPAEFSMRTQLKMHLADATRIAPQAEPQENPGLSRWQPLNKHKYQGLFGYPSHKAQAYKEDTLANTVTFALPTL